MPLKEGSSKKVISEKRKFRIEDNKLIEVNEQEYSIYFEQEELERYKKRKLEELILNHEAEMQRNVTDRWKADMNSDSWLSKNVRPLVLIFLVVSTVLMIFIDADKLVESVGGVLDNLTTTKEEKLAAQAKIKDMIMGYEAEMQKQVTERWKLDMNSDSWLSKNIRPLVLVFLVVSTVLLVFIDAGFIKFNVKDSYVDLLQLVLITVIGAYFGGRSLEKVKK